MENKKRRLGRNPVDELLPDALLLKVISYLPRENRLLFAVALTAPSHNWRYRRRGRRHSGPSPKSSMVLTLSNTDWRNDWGEFDFGNVALAAGRRYFPLGGLSDDDLRAALLCIDAKNTVRSLKLSKCYGLSGKGWNLCAGQRFYKGSTSVSWASMMTHASTSAYPSSKSRRLCPFCSRS